MFTNDTGFFQRGKSFGGKGLLGQGGVISDIQKKFTPKLYPTGYNELGQRVCPYTGKPLKTEAEKQAGVSSEVNQFLNNISSSNNNSISSNFLNN